MHDGDSSVVVDDDALSDDDTIDVFDDNGKSVAESSRSGLGAERKGLSHIDGGASGGSTGKPSLKHSLASFVVNKSNKSTSSGSANKSRTSPQQSQSVVQSSKKNQATLRQSQGSTPTKARSSSTAFLPSTHGTTSKKAKLRRTDSGESDSVPVVALFD